MQEAEVKEAIDGTGLIEITISRIDIKDIESDTRANKIVGVRERLEYNADDRELCAPRWSTPIEEIHSIDSVPLPEGIKPSTG